MYLLFILIPTQRPKLYNHSFVQDVCTLKVLGSNPTQANLWFFSHALKITEPTVLQLCWNIFKSFPSLIIFHLSKNFVINLSSATQIIFINPILLNCWLNNSFCVSDLFFCLIFRPIIVLYFKNLFKAGNFTTVTSISIMSCLHRMFCGKMPSDDGNFKTNADSPEICTLG